MVTVDGNNHLNMAVNSRAVGSGAAWRRSPHQKSAKRKKKKEKEKEERRGKERERRARKKDVLWPPHGTVKIKDKEEKAKDKEWSDM